jgi:hypothetical protein
LSIAPFQADHPAGVGGRFGALTAIDIPYEEDIMNVSELIEILSDCDPEASVFVMTQRNYPLESTLDGVTVREEFSEDEEGDRDRAANDVVLLEGRHIGYGTADAWDVARRA